MRNFGLRHTCALGAIAISTMFAAPAFAQDAGADDEAEAASQETIVVTGTFIRGTPEDADVDRRRALRAVGGDYSDVVKTTTFTTDVEEYHRVNDERAKYFKSDLPTSALIGVVRLAHPDLMVELEVMAVIPTERFKPQE